MPPTKPRPASTADQAAVLTKATLRAAAQLGLTNKLLATVIGVSEATVSRMRSGDYMLQRGQKPFELAVCSCASIVRSMPSSVATMRLRARGSRTGTPRSMPSRLLSSRPFPDL